MRSKKNPQVDLSRNSSLYFMVGLTVALFTIWQLLEYKTYETEDEFVQVLEVAEDIKEEVPVTQQIRTAPPPPPPAAPAVIEVVEDELEIEETIIESTESSQETEVAEAVVSVDDVEVGEEEEEISDTDLDNNKEKNEENSEENKPKYSEKKDNDDGKQQMTLF